MIPDEVTEIGNSCFSGCSALENVKFGENLNTIGDSAFINCTSLTDLELPDGLNTIGEWAFRNCDSLTNVTVPGSVTSMDVYIFSNCDNLEYVTFEHGIKKIPQGTVAGCPNLKAVFIPLTANSIGYVVFHDTKGLTDVYYGGSEEDWEYITVEYKDNKYLQTATIHYNCTGIPFEPEEPEEPEVREIVYGDVNGAVTNLDAMLALQYFVGLADESKVNVSAADVNNDGSITNLDAMLILQRFVGLITEFPAEK